ncbi:PQQ-binding-like beta-propeller repeat protein [Leifsonia sp. TF02-11]|uniref:PQQ-binding-like beta-propeller repeat protein n=1 Tax=Leifsonia sp. TF02-11 TaxID=2815212 RepID=UPI001AA187CA|nr:PQQ-binding-like beta-propeller repeat protein [Leifsonia sp. TF02-11]
MSTTDFSPERSAAIRQLLLDTVADEPRRRKRLQILLTSLLSAVAILLAGGTAALALTGVIHLGGGDTPPAPVPTPTQTVTPTPTPTPTPTQRSIAVQASPITLHDVTSIPKSPSWVADLPGYQYACQQIQTYDIADGLALFSVGSNLGPAHDGCPIGKGVASLSMMDTTSGRVVWSRSWQWESDKGYGTFLSILGTSNRAVLMDESGTTGPRDIIDLATGSTIATLPNDLGKYPNWRISPVWGPSGDVIWSQPVLDAAGTMTAIDVQRIDPRDFASAKWKTTIPAVETGRADVGFVSDGLVSYSYRSPTLGWRSALLDLSTGELSNDVPSDAAYADARMSDTVVVQYRDFISGIPGTVAGIDRRTGETLWTKPFEQGSSISVVRTIARQPGSFVSDQGMSSGEFALVTPHTLTHFDAVTGSPKMTADVTHCGLAGWYWANGGPDIEADDSRNSIVLVLGPWQTCSVDRETGAPTPLQDHEGGWPLFGTEATYVNGAADPGGTGSAFDRRDGRELWNITVDRDERWYFAGGVLVRQLGNHIEPIG